MLAQHTANSVSELQGELLFRTVSRGKSKQMEFRISQLSWLTAIAAFSGISVSAGDGLTGGWCKEKPQSKHNPLPPLYLCRLVCTPLETFDSLK